MTDARPFDLSRLEVAAGLALGLVELDGELDRVRPSSSLRKGIEEAILPALERPPCLVSFSGGRDSSAVLAVATSVARREGLLLPIPATNRFPAAPETDESAWQERIVQHLGLSDWLRNGYDDELDHLGPIATRTLRKHGLLWPHNAHFMVPLLEAAQGGSLLTGVGGDELFAPSPFTRATALLRGEIRPKPRDLARLGVAVLPRAVRRRLLRRRSTIPSPWLSPAGEKAMTDAVAAQQWDEPLRWSAKVQWWWRHRHLRLLEANYQRLAADHGVHVVHPFADAQVAATLAQTPGPVPSSSRSQAMTILFGDLLPEELCVRRDKPIFNDVFWNRHSRAFITRWDGSGVDETYVELEALRNAWNSDRPPSRTALLLQRAWLLSSDGA